MDSVYYAYFEPYSWERHLELLDRAQLFLIRMLASTVVPSVITMSKLAVPFTHSWSMAESSLSFLASSPQRFCRSSAKTPSTRRNARWCETCK